MQFLLMGLGASAFVLVLLAFPETAHVRGIDTIRSERASLSIGEHDAETCDAPADQTATSAGWIRRRLAGFTWVWLNPLAPVRLLMHPNIAAMVSYADTNRARVVLQLTLVCSRQSLNSSFTL